MRKQEVEQESKREKEEDLFYLAEHGSAESDDERGGLSDALRDKSRRLERRLLDEAHAREAAELRVRLEGAGARALAASVERSKAIRDRRFELNLDAVQGGPTGRASPLR